MRVPAAPLSRFWLPILAFGLGAAILWGGDERFTSPALSTPRAIAPWWAWGLLFIAAAFAQIIVPEHDRWLVLLAVAFPYGLFGASQAWSVVSNPLAAATGVMAYSWMAAWHLRVAYAERHHHGEPNASVATRAPSP